MKKILAVVALVALMVALTGCNKTIFDTTYNFDEAIVRLADDTIVRGEVQKWDDYEGDQIQVKIDGVTYLVHAENITLIAR
jgi:hypothetical protein